MPIRKSNDIANESHSTFDNVKSTIKVTEITERFNDAKNDNILPGDEALSYLSKKIDECVDEINLNQSKITNINTNLSATANGTSLTINSSDGTNVSVPAATTSAWGVMTDEMFDAIAANTAKTPLSIGTRATDAMAGNTISVGSVEGASRLTAVASGDSDSGYVLTFSMTIEGAEAPLTITLGFR